MLVIADEVMTGFGRTGRWFGVDQWGITPDIITAGKGTTSGYVPFGFAAASGEIYEAVAAKGFVHGFTWSHNALGAAVALATLRRLRDDGLVDRARDLGAKIKGDLTAALDDVAVVGDVRGIGMMLGIELVDRPRRRRRRSRGRSRPPSGCLPPARDAGLLLYSSTGHVDGANGDLIMLGPPFTLTDDDTDALVERTVGGGPLSRARERPCAGLRRSRRRRGSTTTGRSIRSVPIACCSRGT